MKVKLLLKEDIDTLGKTGDVVEVRLGYARNYLLPRNLATEINKSTLQEIEALKKRKAVREAALKQELSAVAERVKETPVKLFRRVTQAGTLYGSVVGADIAKALAEAGISVEARQVKLESPIKAVGSYAVVLALHSEISAECQVTVAASDEEPAAMTLEEEEAARAREEEGEDAETAAPAAEE